MTKNPVKDSNWLNKREKIINDVGISSVDMVDHNLPDGGLLNIHRMYQSKWMV